MSFNGDARKPSVCLGCTKRWVNPDTGENCHATCAEYLAEHKQNQAVNLAGLKENETICYYKDTALMLMKRKGAPID